jgi:hypothetical protein
MAQRYAAAAQPPPAPAPPFVSALSQSSLSVTWRDDLAGFPVSYYELYVDDGATPLLVTNIMWVGTQFEAGTTHSFSLKYKLTDGRGSPRSETTIGKTWSADANNDGLPDDWQRLYWGINSKNWGGKEADSDHDGASNWQEFLADTDPTDETSVLRTFASSTPLGTRLNWNAVAGLIYQVQVSTDLKSWTDFGAARFAPGSTDSIPLSPTNQKAYYRVIRIR